jgi:hypothetical protein
MDADGAGCAFYVIGAERLNQLSVLGNDCRKSRRPDFKLCAIHIRFRTYCWA